MTPARDSVLWNAITHKERRQLQKTVSCWRLMTLHDFCQKKKVLWNIVLHRKRKEKKRTHQPDSLILNNTQLGKQSCIKVFHYYTLQCSFPPTPLTPLLSNELQQHQKHGQIGETVKKKKKRPCRLRWLRWTTMSQTLTEWITIPVIVQDYRLIVGDPQYIKWSTVPSANST